MEFIFVKRITVGKMKNGRSLRRFLLLRSTVPQSANIHGIWYVHGTQEKLFILYTITISEIVVIELVPTGGNYQ